MNDVIHLLPDKVANQIAAGEVIQRPASVVKELIENAVDAGARHITLNVRDAGRTLIQCIDDGAGMSDVDARMAFERHATSKISSADDLEMLVTMGFRGEALASIAAVAKVELRTRLHGQEMGTRLLLAGAKVESQEPDAAVIEGTNMMVKDLFFNVPARRRFLKKDNVEFSHIMREFERLMLVNPGIDFTLTHNDSTILSVRGTTSLLQRICDIFGRGLDKGLIEVNTDTSIVKIEGFVGLPEHCRRRGALQYLMVNGRNMRHPFFHKALMSCYDKLIPSDVQPNYFLNFVVEPSTIDVNIHPTKMEIKFENEYEISHILMAAIREALGRANAVPSIDFNRDDSPEIPVYKPDTTRFPQSGSNPAYNPFNTSAQKTAPVGWQQLYDDLKPAATVQPPVSQERKPVALQSALDMDFDSPGITNRAIQLRNRYILTPTHDGLMVVDQHRAHLRILYERYMRAMEGKREERIAPQKIMFGQVLRLSPAQDRLLRESMKQITDLGFELNPLGDNDWSVTAAPPMINEGAIKDILCDWMATIEESGNGKIETAKNKDIVREKLALAMANAGAVKIGQPLSTEALERILSELLSLPSPTFTPDGQRTFLIISLDDIARNFD